MGCGKTTVGKVLAERLGWDFADGDDFHPPANVDKMRRGIPLEDGDRAGWLASLRRHMDAQMEKVASLVLACSALKQDYRDMLGIDQQRAVSVYLKGSPELLKKRIAHRTHQYMNESLLKSQLATMEEPDDGLTVSISNSPELICAEIITQLGIGS